MGQTKTASKRGATKTGSKSKSRSKAKASKAVVAQQPTGIPTEGEPQSAAKSIEKTNRIKDDLNIPSGFRDVNIHENNPDLASARLREEARQATSV